MNRWEYFRLDRGWGDLKNLDELGAQGWELVGFTDDGTFVFKRQLPDDEI